MDDGVVPSLPAVEQCHEDFLALRVIEVGQLLFDVVVAEGIGVKYLLIDSGVEVPPGGEGVGMVVESCRVDFLLEKLQTLFFGDGDAVQL